MLDVEQELQRFWRDSFRHGDDFDWLGLGGHFANQEALEVS